MQKPPKRGLSVFTQETALDERLNTLASRLRGSTTIYDRISADDTSDEELNSTLLSEAETRSREGAPRSCRKDDASSDQ